MSLKENIKKSFSNEKELALLRYNSVKTILVFSSLLFFSNFFILLSGDKIWLFYKVFTIYLFFSSFIIIILFLFFDKSKIKFF